MAPKERCHRPSFAGAHAPQPDWLARRRMAAQLVQVLGRNAPPIGQQNLGLEVSEQVCWQCKRADTGEFVGFLANALQAGVTGAKAQGEQWSTIILAACRIGMRRFETEVCRNPSIRPSETAEARSRSCRHRYMLCPT